MRLWPFGPIKNLDTVGKPKTEVSACFLFLFPALGIVGDIWGRDEMGWGLETLPIFREMPSTKDLC